ncbi:hypothetical protein K3495_g13157 [Podosphaera aphanis]|nr:hypothetical protein K3495_g13157 [Podosphaera aphanis]
MQAPKEPTREELLADSHSIPDSDSPRPASPAWSKSTVMSMLSVAMSTLDTASSRQANRAESRLAEKALSRASSLGLGLDDDDDDLDPFQALEKKGYHWDTFDEAVAAVQGTATAAGFSVRKRRPDTRRDKTIKGYSLECDHARETTAKQMDTAKNSKKTHPTSATTALGPLDSINKHSEEESTARSSLRSKHRNLVTTLSPSASINMRVTRPVIPPTADRLMHVECSAKTTQKSSNISVNTPAIPTSLSARWPQRFNSCMVSILRATMSRTSGTRSKKTGSAASLPPNPSSSY